MKFMEYGATHPDVILLLHGGGLSWWNYRETAELLQHDYHVILPILDGHAGSDRDFTSIEANAADLIAFIDSHCNGSVLLIGGLSLGAQILVEMLSQRSDICQFALIESALVFPMRMTNALIGPTLDMSYSLIRQPWFARLQFKSLKIKPSLYDAYYADTCALTKENMIAFLKANSQYTLKKELASTKAKAHIWVGERENALMLRSARQLQQQIPDSVLEIKKGLSHGEYAINHAKAYADQVFQILENA